MTVSLILGFDFVYAQFQGGTDDGLAMINFLSTVSPSIQCYGGQGDGQALVLESGSVSPGIYYVGGNGDGDASLFTLESISEGIYLSGGNNDGMAMNTALSSISPLFYCKGGNEDGFGEAGYFGSTYGIGIYCKGGNEDGVAWLSMTGLIASSIYCQGGNGDGQDITGSTEFILGEGIWTGYVSSNWNSHANWTNSLIPGNDASVAIPAGCIHYPVISNNLAINNPQWGGVQCRQLDIRSGASFTSTGLVQVNGLLNIAGQYQHTNTSPQSFHVSPVGEIVIKQGGALFIQP